MRKSYKLKNYAYLIFCLLLLTPLVAKAVETWNEATPASTESPTLGDDRIREFKTAMRERLAVDHDFEASESPAFGASGSTIGFHKGLRLKEQSSSPTTITDMAAFWAADDGAGNTELFMRGHSNATAYQLTEGDCQYFRKEVIEVLKDLNATYTEINQLASVIVGGTASGDIVTNAGTQTLTNKSLTTPSINTAQLDATGDEVDKAADGIGAASGPPRQIVKEIGDWNMDSTSTVSVAHGLTVSKIIGLRVYIRRDENNQGYPAPSPADDFATTELKVYILGSNVGMARATGSRFDSTNYDSTSYNRGWIIIDYID